jgi:hypothetical protein
VFGYTGESQEIGWDEQYLLNDFLEVKDLVSWLLGGRCGRYPMRRENRRRACQLAQAAMAWSTPG